MNVEVIKDLADEVGAVTIQHGSIIFNADQFFAFMKAAFAHHDSSKWQEIEFEKSGDICIGASEDGHVTIIEYSSRGYYLNLLSANYDGGETVEYDDFSPVFFQPLPKPPKDE